MYNHANLLLGQLGALHPVNRYAAFVTGRLKQGSQAQFRNVGKVTNSSVNNAQFKVPGSLATAKPACQSTTASKEERRLNFAPQTVRAMLAGKSVHRTEKMTSLLIVD